MSLTATALALLLGVPLGAALALRRFRGRRVLLAVANTGMGLPPVVVGLFVTVLLWRSGPLGAFGLLYTPTAMVVAQAAIATPIVIALVAAALQQVDPDFLPQMRASARPAPARCWRCSPRPGCRCSPRRWPRSGRW